MKQQILCENKEYNSFILLELFVLGTQHEISLVPKKKTRFRG